MHSSKFKTNDIILYNVKVYHKINVNMEKKNGSFFSDML